MGEEKGKGALLTWAVQSGWGSQSHEHHSLVYHLKSPEVLPAAAALCFPVGCTQPQQSLLTEAEEMMLLALN